MNSVKSVCGNFESIPENVKKDLLSFGDSRFDGNKNKVIIFIKTARRFSGSLFE